MSKSVLFICTGNVCRSPMAEGYFRHLAREGGHDIAVTSAGVGAMEGLPPSANSIAVMEEEGVDIRDQRSQMLTPPMVSEYTHIFGMARSHIDVIRSYFPESVEKTFVLREFLVDGDLDLDVPDPIGGDMEDYLQSKNLIMEAMPGVLNFVLTGDPDSP